MRIQLSDHFTYRRLLRFVAPTIVMMVINALYGIVDGIFVSNLVGKTAFAAVNLVIPIMMCIGSVGYMIGTGGSAIVAITLGEGKKKLTNQRFSMILYAITLASVFLSVLGFLFLCPVLSMLGAEGELLEIGMVYGHILFTAQTAAIIQNVFQMFCSTAGKPQLSLNSSAAAGLVNVFLDRLLLPYSIGVLPALPWPPELDRRSEQGSPCSILQGKIPACFA